MDLSRIIGGRLQLTHSIIEFASFGAGFQGNFNSIKHPGPVAKTFQTILQVKTTGVKSYF